MGVRILAIELDLGVEWLTKREPSICRALMYAAKDLPEDLPETTRLQALETMAQVLKKCNEVPPADEAAREKVKSLASLFVLELAHTSKHVRQAAQESLAKLSEYSGIPVHEFVAPMKARLVSLLTNKPLRALPFAIQIGYIDAVTYCLKLQNDVLETNESVSRFIKETITLAETPDDTTANDIMASTSQGTPQSSQNQHNAPGTPANSNHATQGNGTPTNSQTALLSTSGKPHDKMLDQRHVENIVKLRVACLQLLAVAIDLREVMASPSDKLRHKVITIFFQRLYARSPEVVSAADEALRAAVVDTEVKLPKDLLQSGLRPVLFALQHLETLKVEVLDCLARLLLLLKTYFKVEIGARLLDNMPKIIDSASLQTASFGLVEHHDRINVAAGIVNIFHLLPPSAKDFMEKLVNIVLDVERQKVTANSSWKPRRPDEGWRVRHAAQLRGSRLHASSLRSYSLIMLFRLTRVLPEVTPILLYSTLSDEHQALQ